MAATNIVKAIPLTSILSSALSGTYQAINSTGLPNACFLIKIINNSDEDITVSYNGSTDNDFIPKATVFQLPAQSNAQPNNYIAKFAIGTKVYVKGSAGMSGSIYLAGYYQPTQ